MEYPSISQQIVNILRVGRNAQRDGLTEVARIQAELIAQLAREYIYQDITKPHSSSACGNGGGEAGAV